MPSPFTVTVPKAGGASTVTEAGSSPSSGSVSLASTGTFTTSRSRTTAASSTATGGSLTGLITTWTEAALLGAPDRSLMV